MRPRLVMRHGPRGRYGSRSYDPDPCGSAPRGHPRRPGRPSPAQRPRERDAMAGEDSEKRTATLSYPGGEHTMEIVEATEGASGVALGKMLGETGLVTLDPGF